MVVIIGPPDSHEDSEIVTDRLARRDGGIVPRATIGKEGSVVSEDHDDGAIVQRLDLADRMLEPLVGLLEVRSIDAPLRFEVCTASRAVAWHCERRQRGWCMVIWRGHLCQ